MASPPDLLNYFDRVLVLNLRRRPDRMTAFRERLATGGWPFREPERFEATDGNSVPVPNGWQMGSGTWGCLQSHRRMLEAAIQDRVKCLLVLEDDACWRHDLAEKAQRFLTSVPEDWDQLMLGGQHIQAPRQVRPGVVQCSNCQRTHAYAIRGRFLRDLYAVWCARESWTHCDHIMGPLQSSYRVYAPDPFLFGQVRSTSDISGARNPTKFWEQPRGQEPILLLHCSREAVQRLRQLGVHTGYTRCRETDLDLGLVEALKEPYDESKLRRWVIELQWEVVSEEGWLLGVWHPNASRDKLEACWSGPVKILEAWTPEEAEEKLSLLRQELQATPPPASALYPPPEKGLIVLLEADRSIVAQLRGLGWHTGHWRDPITDLDNGLREWAHTRDADRLREVVDTLCQEALDIQGGIPCLWHPDLTVELVSQITRRRVLHIRTQEVNEAVLLLYQAQQETPA